MSSNPPDDNNNLPPWLRDVPLPARPTPPPSAQPAADDSALPEWLRDSQAAASASAMAQPDWMRDPAEESVRAPQDDQSALPDWLRDTQPSAPTASGAGALPDWLSDLAEPSSPPEPPPAPAAGNLPQGTQEPRLPDWLRDSQDSTPAASEPSAAPAWLRDETPAPASDESQVQPSWLSDLTAEINERDNAAAAEPDWLSGSAAPDQPESDDDDTTAPAWLGNSQTEAQPAAPDEGAIPTWLRDTNDAEQPPPAAALIDLWGDEEPAAPAAPTASQGESVPSWLRDVSAKSADDEITAEPFSFSDPDADDADITAEPFSFSTGSDTAQDASPAGPPAWLSNAAGEQDNAEITPDWLAATTNQSQAGIPGATPDVPLWLQDLESQPDESQPITPAQAEREPAPAIETPDWLRDVGAAEPAPTQDTPAWLRDADAAPAPAAPEPPAAPGALPDWLRDADAAEPAPIQDTPAWLRDADAAPPPAAPEPPAAPGALPDWLRNADAAEPAPTQDTPAWLRDADAGPPPTAETTPAWLRDADTAPPPAAGSDLPAWLHDTQPEPPAQPSVPEWLGASAATPAAAPDSSADLAPGSAAPAPTSGDDLPEWLRPAAPPTPSAPTMPTPAQPASDLPPWLRDDAGQALPSAGAASESNLPNWLRGVPTETPPSLPAASTSTDWLGIDEPQPAASRAPAGENEFFGGTELPAWLRPAEPEPPKEISPSDTRSLDWLSRLGSVEEQENASTISTPLVKLAPPMLPARTPAQNEALALLERLAAEPFPAPLPLPETAQPSVWRRIGIERVLYLLLLLAVVLALAFPLPASFGLGVPPTAPGAEQLFAQIDKLSENDVVLVGYEWDARRNGELRPLEQAVLGHLIQKKVKLVLVSTDPQGTLLLFDFRDQLEQAGYRGGGEDYILLGYKPGAELALRSIAQDFGGVLRSDFQGNDATIGALAAGLGGDKPRLTQLSDLSMMLVLADEPSDVQGWMEQVHRVARQVPLAFLLPAETTPQVQPYLTQPGIDHLAGKQGALAYQQLRGDTGMPAAQVALEASQERIGLLVFVLLFLLGAIAVAVSAAAARRRKLP